MPHTQPATAHADAEPAPRQFPDRAQFIETALSGLAIVKTNVIIARHTSPLLREQADLIRAPQAVVESDDSAHRMVRAMFDANWPKAGA